MTQCFFLFPKVHMSYFAMWKQQLYSVIHRVHIPSTNVRSMHFIVVELQHCTSWLCDHVFCIWLFVYIVLFEDLTDTFIFYIVGYIYLNILSNKFFKFFYSKISYVYLSEKQNHASHVVWLIYIEKCCMYYMILFMFINTYFVCFEICHKLY